MRALGAAGGVFAATAATSGSAATQDTTTATTTGTTTAATTTTGSGAPVNTAAPSITGTAQDNGTLTAATGTWTGAQPISYAYAWQRCDANGANCAAISNGQSQTYGVVAADVGHDVRVVVTATNSAGSASAASPTTSAILAAPSTTTAPTTTTATTGCPAGGAGTVVPVASVGAPALLQVNNFTPVPGKLTASTQSFTLKVVVTDTCNQKVQGALVYATAVPYNQFSVPAEVATGADGSATLTFNRDSAYPASKRQELLAMFVRARKPGDPTLAGIAARRLIGVPVSLKG